MMNHNLMLDLTLQQRGPDSIEMHLQTRAFGFSPIRGNGIVFFVSLKDQQLPSVSSAQTIARPHGFGDRRFAIRRGIRRNHHLLGAADRTDGNNGSYDAPYLTINTAQEKAQRSSPRALPHQKAL